MKQISKWLSFLLVFIVASILYAPVSYAQEQVPVAKKGVIDLRHFQSPELNLTGEWEFYWGKLLTPTQLNNSTFERNYTAVPHQWGNTKIDDKQLSPFGYATYHVTLLLPNQEIGKVKAISLPNIASSYRLWIDGKLMEEVGVVGTTRETSKPMNSENIVSFQVNSNKVEIVIQVSNFSQRKGGIWTNVSFGNQKVMVKENQRYYIITSFLIGSLFIIGAYHLVMYLTRRKERTFLYFAITCLGIAFRMFFLEGHISSVYNVNVPWEWQVKIEYLGAFVAVPFFNMYIHHFFGITNRTRFLKIVNLIHIVYSILILVTPVRLFSLTLPYYSIILLLVFFNMVIISFRALLSKTRASMINFVAITVFFLTILNDVFYYLDFIQTVDLVPFGLYFYLFIQAILLSASISESFNREELMTQELALMNTNLESIVEDRTKEIVTINSKLQKELDNRIQLISSISHEMRSPLTTIKGFTRGLIDGLFKTDNDKKLQTIFDETMFMERMLDDLFELSLLELGKLNFYFERKNPVEFFQKLFEKYEFEVTQAGLTFQFEVEKDTDVEVNIDPIRMEQVFVNLLRNALRNTVRGSISVKLLCNQNDITVSIADTGSGIEPEILPKIFTKFMKGNNQNNYKSTGIGLSICKEILKGHQGDITVESQLGEGSTFTFTIPTI